MNYYGSKQLTNSFRTVRGNTLTIANEIPEDKYGYKATPDVKSVAELLAHIAVSPMWHIEVHGNRMAQIDHAFFADRMQKAGMEEKALRSKSDIIKALTDNGETLSAFIQSLDEATLAEQVTIPTGDKSRFEMLLGAKEHEMHHRGQLMLIQRMLGQVPELTRRRQAMMANR